MPTGKTKDAGWQIGVSKTVDHPLDEVWDMVAGPGGLAIWLGTGVELDGEAGQAYEADDGTVGEVRSFRPHDRIRLTWQPPDW
ncbi:MAG: SRPBCC domain-containing protein, partial [Actinomycetota bacterium]